MPSFSITCVGPLGLLLLVELAGVALADQGVAAGLGAGAAHLVGGDDGDAGVEDALHPGLEEQRHLDHGDLGPGRQRGEPGADPLADQRVDLRLEPGELLGVGEDDLADPGAVDRALRRDVLAPALDQAAEQRLGVEQLVDDRVAGDRRRAEALEGGEGGRLARRDPAREADRQRRH